MNEQMKILGFPVVVSEKEKANKIKMFVGTWYTRISLILEKRNDGTFVLKRKDKNKPEWQEKA